MKKVMIAASAIFILALVGYAVMSFFASDETRIRRLILGMQKCFNKGDALRLCAGLAQDFQDVDSGLGREDILRILYGTFHGERLPSGAFPHRVELAGDPEAENGLQILLDKNPQSGALSARLRVTVTFFRQTYKDGDITGESPTASIEFEGQLLQEDGNWKIHRARMKLLEGRLPF